MTEKILQGFKGSVESENVARGCSTVELKLVNGELKMLSVLLAGIVSVLVGFKVKILINSC